MFPLNAKAAATAPLESPSAVSEELRARVAGEPLPLLVPPPPLRSLPLCDSHSPCGLSVDSDSVCRTYAVTKYNTRGQTYPGSNPAVDAAFKARANWKHQRFDTPGVNVLWVGKSKTFWWDRFVQQTNMLLLLHTG